MNNWYRNYQKILEAPISDINIVHQKSNTDFNDGTAFDNLDKKLVNKPEHQARIFKAFQNTPYNFKIYFMNHNHFDGSSKKDNNDVGTFVDGEYVGVPSTGIYSDSIFGINPQNGVINVIVFGNLSMISNVDKKLPMTPWILAHKIGHAIQESERESTQYKDFSRYLESLMRQYAKFGEEPTLFNFKSARDNILPYSDIDAEVIAEFIITGKCKMKKISEIESKILNESLDQTIKSVVGKILLTF